MDPLLVRWSSPALDRRLPDCMYHRKIQGIAGSGGAAAVAAARLRLVSAVVFVVCWSKDLVVISFTAEVLCTAGETSI